MTVGNHEPKKGQAMQRCREEQSARSKGARLSPLELRLYNFGVLRDSKYAQEKV